MPEQELVEIPAVFNADSSHSANVAPAESNGAGDFSLPYTRLLEAAECTTQVQLAAFLGVCQSSISSAKQRGVIPSDWLLTLLFKKYINPNWILTGKGPKYLQPCENGVPVAFPE